MVRSSIQYSRLLPGLLGMLVVSALVCVPDRFALADSFQLEYRTGDLLTVDVRPGPVSWLTVSARGEMSKRDIPLSEIRNIKLTTSPASEQLSQIRILIAQLGDDDYLVRQRAEQELRIAGRRFRKILEQELGQLSPEANYRLDRIIGQLRTSRGEVEELDELTFTNGKSIDGDLGDFSLECEFQGKTLTVKRSQLAGITRADSMEPLVFPPQTEIVVEQFHHHTDFVDEQTQRTITFSNSAEGKELAREDSVETVFTDWGVLFETPNEKGFVGISGYPFSFENLPVSGNSICVFRTRQSLLRFQGVMEIRFCVPGQPGVPAAVNEFGLFMARVNHSRDFIMEAYDHTGQLLAAVESTDQQCSFTGLKSSQPISRIRILSNPYLDRVTRMIDLDFAVDTVYVSKTPVPVRNERFAKKEMQLRNGDRFYANSLKFSDDGQVSYTTRLGFKGTTELTDVASIGYVDVKKEVVKSPVRREAKQKTETPDSDLSGWQVMLSDHSIVKVDPGKTFNSKLLGHSFSPKDVRAVWPAGQPLRTPMKGDFQRGSSLFVYPTCRIATLDVEFSKDSFSWMEGEKIEEMLLIGKKPEKEDVDPGPIGKSEYFAEKKSHLQPTVWLSKPETVVPDSGMIHLIDGQRFCFGNNALFKLRSIGKTGAGKNPGDVVLDFDGKPIAIKGDQILAICPAGK